MQLLGGAFSSKRPPPPARIGASIPAASRLSTWTRTAAWIWSSSSGACSGSGWPALAACRHAASCTHAIAAGRGVAVGKSTATVTPMRRCGSNSRRGRAKEHGRDRASRRPSMGNQPDHPPSNLCARANEQSMRGGMPPTRHPAGTQAGILPYRAPGLMSRRYIAPDFGLLEKSCRKLRGVLVEDAFITDVSGIVVEESEHPLDEEGIVSASLALASGEAPLSDAEQFAARPRIIEPCVHADWAAETDLVEIGTPSAWISEYRPEIVPVASNEVNIMSSWIPSAEIRICSAFFVRTPVDQAVRFLSRSKFTTR